MKIKPCPGCNRDRKSCWTMPCLYLEIVLRRGKAATGSWLRAGGAVKVSS